MLIKIAVHSTEVLALIDNALQFLADVRPDSEILDADLNGTRSYPIAVLLRSCEIPFVFMSGYDAAILDIAYANLRILQKPFRIDDFDSAIEATFTLGA